jgi:rhodanese-related sulfurtransferase
MESKTLVPEIFTSQANQLLKDGALLIDVREKEEVRAAAYDVTNQMYVPLSDFDKQFHSIPKDQTLVMACKSGGRSLRAANFLINHGYDKVFNLRGGITGWAAKGFPIKGELRNDNACDCSNPDCC